MALGTDDTRGDNLQRAVTLLDQVSNGLQAGSMSVGQGLLFVLAAGSLLARCLGDVQLEVQLARELRDSWDRNEQLELRTRT